MGQAQGHDYQERIDRALHFLDTHPTEKLDMDGLADLACFSRFHFQRIFSGLVGETPGGYLRRIRLENARRMIGERPGRSLTEIALACGFTSSTLFSRMFKARFGCSPRDARKVAALPQAPARPQMAGIPRPDRRAPPCLEGGVRIVRQEGLRVACIRCSGYGPSLGLAYFKLFRALRKYGLLDSSTRPVGISYDDPLITDRRRCRYYAGASIQPDQDPPPGILAIDLPAGRVAMLRFQGRLKDLDDAFSCLFSAWLPASGEYPADAPLHQYILRNPYRDGGEGYELDICLPLLT